MLCKGDSIGVFQVESRAQMNMLPRLKPREFYDLVIQVAIVRPGPIQGDMVHPYLCARRGGEGQFPPRPPHGIPTNCAGAGPHLGVPLFQEQAMKLAMVAAEFTPDEANKLRRAMATFRNVGTIHKFEEEMVERMVARGYEPSLRRALLQADQGLRRIWLSRKPRAGASRKLVYVSSWLKCHHPAVFACALLNSAADGLLCPGPDRARCARAWRGGAAKRWRRITR
jgi:error-prone DNA polymerase